jgi:predicted CopG family antitoxin
MADKDNDEIKIIENPKPERKTRGGTRIETRSNTRIGMTREEVREQENENRRRISRGPGGLSTGRRPNYSMVRLRQTAINRLKTFKSGSDSINDTIEELLNYYEANNQFLHTKLERFEEDLIEGGRVRYFFPTGDNVEESELTITKLIRFLRESFENVTFVKYEYTTGEGIIGAPTYVITFYTEKRGIRRPFFMMMASVDNINGVVPHDPAEKNMAKGEAFFGWKPLFIASESEFRPDPYVENNYRKVFDQYLPSDIEEFIKDEIKLSYDLSRGQIF